MAQIRISILMIMVLLCSQQNVFSQEETMEQMVARGWKHKSDDFSIQFLPDHHFFMTSNNADTIKGHWEFDSPSRYFLVRDDEEEIIHRFYLYAYRPDTFTLANANLVLKNLLFKPIRSAPKGKLKTIPEPTPDKRCATCNGAGQVWAFDLPCNNVLSGCSNGKINCSRCLGTGKERDPKYIGESCISCSGTGKEICTVCYGTGKKQGIKQCNSCMGSGISYKK